MLPIPGTPWFPIIVPMPLGGDIGDWTGGEVNGDLAEDTEGEYDGGAEAVGLELSRRAKRLALAPEAAGGAGAGAAETGAAAEDPIGADWKSSKSSSPKASPADGAAAAAGAAAGAGVGSSSSKSSKLATFLGGSAARLADPLGGADGALAALRPLLAVPRDEVRGGRSSKSSAPSYSSYSVRCWESWKPEELVRAPRKSSSPEAPPLKPPLPPYLLLLPPAPADSLPKPP